LDNDGYYEIIANNELGTPIYMNHKGRKKDFFKVELEDSFARIGDPIAADIDNDGNIEILMSNIDGFFRCYNSSGFEEWSIDVNDYYSCTPSLINIDNDGTLAILVTENRDFSCINYNGSLRWSSSIEDGGIWRTPAIFDINNDGSPEILAYGTIGSYSSYGDALFCYDINGNQLWNYTGVYAFPMIVDINGDSEYEIIIGKAGIFVTINSDGEGEDLFISKGISSGDTCCMGDINDDGSLELVTTHYTRDRVRCYTIPSANEASGNWWTFQGNYQHLGYPDTDGDLIDDMSEGLLYNTNYLDSDTDNDNMIDGWEIEYGLNPLIDDSQQDIDRDGYTNIKEYNRALNPNKWDNRIRLYTLFLLPLWISLLAVMIYFYIKLRPLTPRIIKILRSVGTTIYFQTRRIFIGKFYTKDDLAQEYKAKQNLKKEREKLKEDAIRDRMI